MTGPTDQAPSAEVEQPTQPETQRWEGVLGIEGEMTGDGRFIEVDAIEWDATPDNPIPLRVVMSDVGAHDGATIAGRIQTVERRPHPENPDARVIWGAGDFDMGGESGKEAFRLVSEDMMTGVSMDLDNVVFEVRGADGTALTGPDDDSTGAEVTATVGARLRAATLVAVPAFATAKIAMAAAEETDPTADEASAPVVGEDEFQSDEVDAAGHDVARVADEPSDFAGPVVVIDHQGRPVASSRVAASPVLARLAAEGADAALLLEHGIPVVAGDAVLAAEGSVPPDAPARVSGRDRFSAPSGLVLDALDAFRASPWATRVERRVRLGLAADAATYWTLVVDGNTLSLHGAYLTQWQRSLSPNAREAAAERGEAMPGGEFPIRNKADWTRATKAIGRAKDRPKVERWIRKRARELDIPKDEWPEWLSARASRAARFAAPPTGSPEDTDSEQPATQDVGTDEIAPPAGVENDPDAAEPVTLETMDGLDALDKANDLLTKADQAGFPSQAYIDLLTESLPFYTRAVESGDLGDLTEETLDTQLQIEDFLDTDWTDVILAAEDAAANGETSDDVVDADADTIPDDALSISEPGADGLAVVTRRDGSRYALRNFAQTAKQKAAAKKQKARVPKGQKKGGQFKPVPTTKAKAETPAQRKKRMIAVALENAEKIIEKMLVNAPGGMSGDLQKVAKAIKAAMVKGATKAAANQKVPDGKGGGGDPTDPGSASTGKDKSDSKKDSSGKSKNYAQRINTAKKNIDGMIKKYGKKIPAADRKTLKSVSKRLGALASTLDTFSVPSGPLTTAPATRQPAASAETFNWVEDVGGLPKYIKEVSDALQRKGMNESRAIATAVNTIKRWARGGSAAKRGEGHVNVDTIAKAAVALAEWEMKKALAKVTSGRTVTLAHTATLAKKGDKAPEPAAPKTARPDADALKDVKDALAALKAISEDEDYSKAEQKRAASAVKDIEKSLKKISGTHAATTARMRAQRTTERRRRTFGYAPRGGAPQPYSPNLTAPLNGQWRAPRGATSPDGTLIAGMWIDLPDKIVEDLLHTLGSHRSGLGPREQTDVPEATNDEFYDTLGKVTSLVQSTGHPLEVGRSGERANEVSAHLRYLRDLVPALDLARFSPFGRDDDVTTDRDEFLAFADAALSHAIHDLDVVGNINWWDAPTTPDAGERWYGDTDPTDFDDDEIEWDDDPYADRRALTASSREHRERRARLVERRRRYRQTKAEKAIERKRETESQPVQSTQRSK